MTDPVEAEKLCPFSINDMVWAKVRGHPWWPAKMADPKVAPLAVRREMKPNMLLVKFYGQTNYGWIRPDYIKGFKEHQDEFGKKPSILEALKQALKDEKGGLGYDFLHDDPPSEDESDESEDTSSFVDSSDLDESDEDDDDDLIDLKASRRTARALRKAQGNEENRKRPNTNRLQKQQSAPSTPSKTKTPTQSQLLEEDLVRRSIRISCKKTMQQTRRSRRSRSRSRSSSPSHSRSSSRSRSPPSSEPRSAENSRRYYLRTQSPTPIDDLFCSLDEDTASRILKPSRHKRSASSSTSSLAIDSPTPLPPTTSTPTPVVKLETPALASPSLSSPGPLTDTPKKKLKRGRKPKNRLLEGALPGTPGATVAATNPGETPPVKVPGKRGRKRKLVVEDPISPGLEMNGSAAHDNDPNPAKRRKLNNEAPSSLLVNPKSSIKQEPKDVARSATPSASSIATPTSESHAGQTTSTSPQSDSNNNSPSKQQGACATPMKTPKAQKRFQPKKLIPVSLSFVRELQTHLTQAVSLRDDDLIETILHSLCMVKLTVEILRETGIAHQIRQIARQYDQNKNPIKQAARVVINGLKSNLTGELDSMALNMKDDLARSPPYCPPSSSSSIPSKKQKKQPLTISDEASSSSSSSSSSSNLVLSTDASSQLPSESNGPLASPPPTKLSEESDLASPDAQSSSPSTAAPHSHELQEATSDTPMAPPSNGSALEDILDHPPQQQQQQQQQQQLPLLTSPATTVETHLIGSYLAAPTTSSSSSGDSVHLNQNFIINNHHHHHHHHGKNLIDVQTNVYSDPESASLKIKSEIQAKEISLGMILNPISPSAPSPSSSTTPSLVHIPMNNGKFHHSTFQFHAQPSEQSPSSSPLTLPPPPPNVEFLPMPIHHSDQNVPPPHPHPLALPHPSPASLLPSPSSSLSNILLPSHRPL